MILEDNSRWSFRQRARAWLAAVGREGKDARTQSFQAGGAQVLILESGRLSAGQSIDVFLLVRGNFTCGGGCRFRRPLYVAGNCEIGKGSILETLEVDGDLHLAPSVEVRGNAISLGAMEIRPGSRICGLACSYKSIRLGLQASAARLYAPGVLTPDGVRSPARPRAEPPSGVIPILGPGTLNRGLLKVAGIDPRRLQAAGESEWVYEGDLCVERPVLLRSNLYVNGSVSLAAGSLLEASLQAVRGLSLGEGSILRGSLEAGADLLIGGDSVFQGDIVCGQMLRLCSGVRGLRSGRPVNVRAGGELVLEEGVTVRGRLSSGCRVTAVADESFIAHRRVAGKEA